MSHAPHLRSFPHRLPAVVASVRPIAILTVIVFVGVIPIGCDKYQHLAHSPHGNAPPVMAADGRLSFKAHRPNGWRRTKDGWEHTNDWGVGANSKLSLNQHIAEQKSREPQWLQESLAIVRSLSPITIALFQISLISLIFVASERSRKDDSQTKPAT